MMKYLLAIVGGFAVLAGGFNGAIRLFGDAEAVERYAGGTRSLDLAITVVVFGLILLALAAIIERLDKVLAQNEEALDLLTDDDA